MKTASLVARSLLVLGALAALASRATAAAPPVAPLAGIAYQRPELEPLAGNGAIVAFASMVSPSHVTRISLVPVDRLVCDPSNYDALDVYDVDAAGNASGSALYATTTTCAGTGDWTAGKAAISVTLAYDLPAGHALAAIWRPVGAGVALPGGAWRVE